MTIHRKYLSLQIADNMAFEIRKYVVSTLTLGKPVRKSLESIKSAFWRVYKRDYAGLKLIADANDPDSIPVTPLEYTLDEISA